MASLLVKIRVLDRLMSCNFLLVVGTLTVQNLVISITVVPRLSDLQTLVLVVYVGQLLHRFVGFASCENGIQELPQSVGASNKFHFWYSL